MQTCWICEKKPAVVTCRVCGALFCEDCGDFKTRTCENCEGYDSDLPEIQVTV